MKLTLSDKNSEVLATWEIVDDYPDDYDFEDLDNDWGDNKIIISDLKKHKERFGTLDDIENEILHCWENLKRR